MTFNGQIVDFSIPAVMGILNATPDSFHASSRVNDSSEVVDAGLKMWEEGAAFIDLGGQSTRPGATPISASEELDRVMPLLEALIKANPEGLISIDTYYAEVARAAVEGGACMVNDVSAGSLDKALWKTVAELKVPYVLMHMQGVPSNMQDQPQYKDVSNEVARFLGLAQKEVRKHGIDQIILDPGFGFGKTLEHNYELLHSADQLGVFGHPVMMGVSRKSMVNNVLNVKAKDALNGTTALHMIALEKGADILRVHDVKEAKEAIEIHTYDKHVAL